MSAGPGAPPDASGAGPDWPLVVGLLERSERARDRAELGFVIANETWQLLPYRQAALFRLDPLGAPLLQTVSGLASLSEETPFTLWLGRLCRLVEAAPGADAPRRLAASMLDAELAAGWREWWPPHAVAVPLVHPAGGRLGLLVLVREEPWRDADLALLGLLAGHWAYCLRALTPAPGGLAVRWRRWRAGPRRRWLLLAAVLLALAPVRLSALAPAEVIALQAEAVAAPADGVVKVFHAPPNSAVRRGQLLFSLDDTTLRNRRAVATKALAVAQADARTAQQKAFDNAQSRAELATLLGRVREREAELAFVDESLSRLEVRAAIDGLFVYGDPNDWLGRPVVTGERIAQLAQPGDLGVLVWLPVADAINLEPGAPIRIYLQVAPLAPLAAELVQTSYQATLSPDGIASYRVRGKLAGGGDARIGLRGVAKLSGAWRPFAYWALRRPLGALRQWLGV